MDTIRKIREILIGREPKPIEGGYGAFIHAAVLMPLFHDETGYKILFTKRTDKVEHHKRQISFPGGAVDNGDGSLQETALRESHEEIGLLRDDVQILGPLDQTTTFGSDFVVHPFVGYIPYPYDFTINPKEVDRIITVPLDVFLSDQAIYKRDRAEFEDYVYQGTSYYYNGDVIWGATARIMENFIHIVGDKLRLSNSRNSYI
ncbi:MAG: CoA pyrophosphatase [Deltaproteobacteria bacterium]|nr:CoA pyrophosphatase [Deltaproteobacteria bacterium]